MQLTVLHHTGTFDSLSKYSFRPTINSWSAQLLLKTGAYFSSKCGCRRTSTGAKQCTAVDVFYTPFAVLLLPPSVRLFVTVRLRSVSSDSPMLQTTTCIIHRLCRSTSKCRLIFVKTGSFIRLFEDPTCGLPVFCKIYLNTTQKEPEGSFLPEPTRLLQSLSVRFPARWRDNEPLFQHWRLLFKSANTLAGVQRGIFSCIWMSWTVINDGGFMVLNVTRLSLS